MLLIKEFPRYNKQACCWQGKGTAQPASQLSPRCTLGSVETSRLMLEGLQKRCSKIKHVGNT